MAVVCSGCGLQRPEFQPVTLDRVFGLSEPVLLLWKEGKSNSIHPQVGRVKVDSGWTEARLSCLAQRKCSI